MKKRKLRLKPLGPFAKQIGRFLFTSQLLTVFLVLCGLGVWVGAQTRPSPNVVPWSELLDHMSVISYRESPADTSARFVVELEAGGTVFSQYDVDTRRFLPPATGRDYSRSITGTHYRPLRIRGHVAHGFWLDVPDSAGRSLLPEQFDELYRTTLGFVKPVSLLTNVLGILSGYSVGYRLATWGGSLSSHAVQARVLATPELGRTLAREAWRRVLLEPVVMFDEDNVARIAAVHGTHRLYANFFRLALNDSDGFIPREAARLAGLGQVGASRTMLAFAAAVQRAARDSVDLGSADFAAVEGWASLLDRRGTWASGAVPPAGEERARYLGTLAWYGLAPPSAEADRVWVGPRMLVKTGDAEGFVTDDIMSTRAGCPITWRARLREENTNASAMVSAWFTDRPEFPALLAFGGRVAGGLASAGRQVAASVVRRGPSPEPGMTRTTTANASGPGAMAIASASARATVTPATVGDAAARRSISCLFRAMGTDASLTLVAADSNATVPDARSVQAVFERVDSLMGGRATSSEVARLNREAASGPTPVHPEVGSVIEAALRVWRESGHAFDPSVEPLGRAWGFLGGTPRLPSPQELDAALAHVGAQHVVFDSLARTLRFDQDGVKLDLGGIARGHAVDAAADTLRARGVRDALVDLSGNAAAIGAPAHAEDWRIGLRDPRDRSAAFARLHLSDGQAVSTSDAHDPFVAADGKSYGRILDPRTGRPAGGLSSVTVVARSATLADAWSTALFVLGPADARRIARERTDLSAVLIEPGTDGVDTVWVESDLKDHLEIDGDGHARYRVVYF